MIELFIYSVFFSTPSVMVGVVFSSLFQGDFFFIFPKKQGKEKVYRRFLYILLFSKKKKKNKKNIPLSSFGFAATDESLYLCSVNVDAAWLEMVPVPPPLLVV